MTGWTQWLLSDKACSSRVSPNRYPRHWSLPAVRPFTLGVYMHMCSPQGNTRFYPVTAWSMCGSANLASPTPRWRSGCCLSIRLVHHVAYSGKRAGNQSSQEPPCMRSLLSYTGGCSSPKTRRGGPAGTLALSFQTSMLASQGWVRPQQPSPCPCQPAGYPPRLDPLGLFSVGDSLLQSRDC